MANPYLGPGDQRMSVGAGYLAGHGASTRGRIGNRAIVRCSVLSGCSVRDRAVGKAQKYHHISQESPVALFGFDRANDTC